MFRPFFSGCGRRIEDTIQSIVEGTTSVDDLPKITVLRGEGGHLFSLNNRRLYTFKQLRQLGALENRTPSNTINVRIKSALPREIKKYSVDSCSLNCTIIHEAAAESNSVTSSQEIIPDSDSRETLGATQTPQTKHTVPKNKKCLVEATTALSISSFQDLLLAAPPTTHADLRKAMKLRQQGKDKQSVAILNKLDSAIDTELRRSIVNFFEYM